MHWGVGALLGAGTALALAACSGGSGSSGTPSGPPPQVLANAVTADAGSSSGTLTVTSFGSTADLNALGVSKADAAQTDKLFTTSSATLTFVRGSGQSEVDVKVNGEDRAADVVATRSTFYLRVDLATVGPVLGVNTSTLKNEAKALNAEVPGLNALANGQYGSIAMTTLAKVSKQIGGKPPVASAAAGSEVSQVFALVRSAFASSQATKVGSDSVGVHYRATIQPGPIAQALEAQLGALVPPLTSLLASTVKEVNAAAAKPATVDAWVSGGKLKQVEVDFRQYHQGAGGPANPVGLKAVFGSSGSVSIPSGATPVDLSKVGGLLSLLGA